MRRPAARADVANPVLAHGGGVVHAAEEDLAGLDVAGSNYDAATILGLAWVLADAFSAVGSERTERMLTGQPS